MARFGDHATTGCRGRRPPKLVKPVNLDCNTKADEDDPFVSSNGFTLYYTSNARKKLDLMVSKRTSGKWGSGKPFEDAYGGYVKTPGDDRGDLFSAAAGRRGLKHDIIEKDSSVCWSLKRLFLLPDPTAGVILKGGTHYGLGR